MHDGTTVAIPKAGFGFFKVQHPLAVFSIGPTKTEPCNPATPGNVADNDFDFWVRLCKGLCRKIFGDKGYISDRLQDTLLGQGLLLVTKVKKNMKNRLMHTNDKLMLKKRGVIESVIGILKNICNIEHSRHRSPANAFVSILAGLAAYSFLGVKPSVKNGYSEIRQCLFDNGLMLVT